MGKNGGGFACASTSCTGTVNFCAPGIVSEVRAGDFNGDGKPDLVIAVSSDPSTVNVLLGDGSGGFGVPTTIQLPTTAIRLLTVDVNEDTKTDLVVSYGFSGLTNPPIADFISSSSETARAGSAAPTAVPLSQTTNQSLVFALGDLNRDGHQDLGLTEIKSSGRQFLVMFGNGTGGFTPQLLADVAPTVNIVTSGDVNGDGFLDLMGSTGSLLQVWIGDGTGAFHAEGAFVAPFGGEVRLADFNGDNRLDAAVAITQGGGVSILLNACGQSPADLSLTVTDTPDPVDEGSPITYAATITNKSAVVSATNVQFTFTLPATLINASATPTQGACSVSPRIITCSLGTLAPGAAAGVSVIATPTIGNPVSITAGVSSDMGDETTLDNTVVVQTSVTPRAARSS